MNREQIKMNSNIARTAYLQLWKIDKKTATEIAGCLINHIIFQTSGKHIFQLENDENHYSITYYPCTNKIEFGIEEYI